MKVAITAWEKIISPVFDSARMLLIVEIKHSEMITRHYEKFNPEAITHLAKNLCYLNIDVLICGAISDVLSNIIENCGIKLIPFIRGNIEEVLDSFTKEVHIDPVFLMPGCGRKRRRKRRNRNVFSNQQREVRMMPRGDGTGPQGNGARTGRGRGGCKAGKTGRNSGQGQGRSGKQTNGRNTGRKDKKT